MKKIFKSIITGTLVVSCCCALAFAGCGGGGDDTEADGYTVTFDYNYSGSTSTTVTVEAGDAVSAPDDPENGNYIFSGWYSDADCTTSYDFSSEVTSNITIYAGWVVVGDDEVAIIYMWNYDGASVYKVTTIEYNTKLSTLDSTAARDGYYLRGWYTDAECTEQYTAGSGRVTSNLTLYALWYEGYTFEAEYTNLNDEYDEPREFWGYSENGNGAQAAVEDTLTGTASNGYYIMGMYLSGSYLYFDIESDAAISDAVLYLRLAFEYGYSVTANSCYDGDSVGTVSVSSDQYVITVNGTQISYSKLSFDVNGLSSYAYTAFADYYIGDISLQEGSNTIRLEVNNIRNGEGGTQNAKAPLVDCMKIYSCTTLTWDPIMSNIG